MDRARLETTLTDAIRDYFEQGALAAHGAPPPLPTEKIRLCTAALVLQVGRADFEVTAEEREAVSRTLERLLGLTPAELRPLLEQAEGEAPRASFPELLAVLDQHASREQKKQLLEALWQVAYADAEIMAHEEYLLRKVADLLRLSSADLIEAKVRARESFR